MNDLEDLSKLCKVTIKTIPERAISINNRQTLLYCNQQTMTIICTDLKGEKYTKRPDVQGLIRITLPPSDDCTVVTKAHKWRADVYLAGYPKIRTKPISLDIVQIFGTVFIDLEHNQREIELPPYSPQSLDSITGELRAVYFKRNTHWALIAAALVVTIILIILVILGMYICRNKQAMAFVKSFLGVGIPQITLRMEEWN